MFKSSISGLTDMKRMKGDISGDFGVAEVKNGNPKQGSRHHTQF
jgi:hypothetical protein